MLRALNAIVELLLQVFRDFPICQQRAMKKSGYNLFPINRGSQTEETDGRPNSWPGMEAILLHRELPILLYLGVTKIYPGA